MSATVDSGHGATVAFGTSAFTSNIPADAEITWSGFTRDAIETTTMAVAAAGAGKVGNRTFIPSRKVDPGSISFPVQFNPDDDPPMQGDEAVETITIQFKASGGDTTGGKWAADGFMVSFNPSNGDPMTADVEVKLSGNVTITDGS